MTHSTRTLLAAIILTVAQAGTCHSAETVRVAVQKTGTFAWELAVIRAHGLDKQANLSVQAVELASPEAGKIALRAGNADIIVSDWLWVSRERTLGAKLTFYPYSSALGAVMVPASSSIQTLADLRGRKLAVAGGPIDKNWLLLQAWLKREGIDLKSDATIAYGAPPLLHGEDARRRNGRGVELLEFLRRHGSKRLSPCREHRGSASKTRSQGPHRDDRLRLRRKMGTPTRMR